MPLSHPRPYTGSVKPIGGGPLTLGLAALLVIASGCGDGDHESSIRRSLEAYFVWDNDPDFDVYCRSEVSVDDQETFRHGTPRELSREARTQERRCLTRSEIVHPTHTGWPDARIGSIQRHGDRATANVTYRLPLGVIHRQAIVARVGKGDWRVLQAGYD